MKKDFIMMVGLPASGKSTIAKKLKTEYELKGERCTIVSTDEIRKELFGDASIQDNKEKVFGMTKNKAVQALKRGDHVIYDATNVNSKKRKRILTELKPYIQNMHQTKAIVTACLPATCIERNKTRETQAGVAAIHMFYNNFEIPFHEEGFDKIEIITAEDAAPMNIERMKSMMDDFEQNTPHHYQTVGHHGDTTARLFEAMCYDAHWCQIAAAWHDVGKLFSKSTDENGVSHYYNHENIGAYVLMCRGTQLKKEMNLTDGQWLNVLFLINYHMRPFNWRSDKSILRAQNHFGTEKYFWLTDFNTCDRTRERECYLDER